MGISKIEVITGMSKLTNLISELSKVGVRDCHAGAWLRH